MKKILISQLDSSYFLNETLALLERHALNLRDCDITILCQSESLDKLGHFGLAKSKFITNIQQISDEKFDQWFNLSIFNFNESISQLIDSPLKKGPGLTHDDWSIHLLTIKEKALYLNIHLQDIYAGVLGLPRLLTTKIPHKTQKIIFGHFRPQTMSFQELTNLTSNLKKSYPLVEFLTIDEVDYLESHQNTLYFGPATLEAIKLSESGAKCVLVSNYFTGMNLIPYQEDCLYITTHGENINASRIEPFIHFSISPQVTLPQTGYSLYQSELTSAGMVFNSLTQSDYQFATYQAFFVLWSYFLSLDDIQLNFTRMNNIYGQQFRNLYDCLDKVSKLNHYSVIHSQTIYQQLQQENSQLELVKESLMKIIDVEEHLEKFASTQLWFNTLYRFFQYKFKQLDLDNLVKSSEERYFLYVEFQQTIDALKELFAVTLNKNEVSID